MKILFFTGGLGNQIFEYAFYNYLKGMFPKDKFYGLYNKKKLSEHYGFEVNRWFNVEPLKATFFSNIVAYSIYLIRHLFNIQRWYDSNRKELEKPGAILFYSMKPNKKYIPDNTDWIKFNIDENTLEEKNKKLLIDIKKANSVSIHVRRGDFMSAENIAIYGGICTEKYYNAALSIIKQRVIEPRFYIFSDDIGWCKRNLLINDASYIDWNTGTNSPIDMYLMANCKMSIIANSSFSYWGARLINKKELVLFPKKWANTGVVPDIFPDDWIGL